MNENINNLKNLLNNATIIQKKFDDLAEYSGEHYNVFDILGVRSNELSHSAILTNLLDTNGKHGQKDTFLKLFIEQIKSALQNSKYNDYFNSFETEKAVAKKEIYLGFVNFHVAEGGRVDIVVSSGGKHIVIENKIYASDQGQQLLRYNNHFKNDPILYLTLHGNEPSEASKGNLIVGSDFICISYKDDIANWLEKCIKEMANRPIIRETLNQYLFLIKSLTNQSNNNKMSEEIRNLINVENANLIPILNQELNNIIEDLKKRIFNSLDNSISDLDKNSYIRVILDQDSDGFFVGYQYYEGTENKSKEHKNKGFYLLINSLCKYKVGSTDSFFAWYNPIGFEHRDKIEYLDKAELLKMYKDEEYFNSFVSKIKNEEFEIRKQFINNVTKMN